MVALIVAACLTTVHPHLIVAQSVSPAASTTPPAAGSLSGSVLADSGDAPIANAEVVFESLKISARSDSKGNFQVTGIPVGPQAVVVRKVGYEPYAATITFGAAQKVEADFILKPVVTKLAKVSVKAAVDSRYTIRLTDFDERRAIGTGRFLTADVFEKAIGQNMSQILMRSIPGIRTIGVGTKQLLVGRTDGRTYNCKVQVIVNGMTRFSGRTGDGDFDINSLYSGEVIGVEYYTLANTPAQFSGTGTAICGTIVVWTK